MSDQTSNLNNYLVQHINGNYCYTAFKHVKLGQLCKAMEYFEQSLNIKTKY